MKTAYLQHDNLDDRRELHHLLKRLSPGQRIDFLRWACQRATLPHSKVHPGVAAKTIQLARLAMRDSSADVRLALDVYFDLFKLASQYDFDLDVALEELVRRVRAA